MRRERQTRAPIKSDVADIQRSKMADKTRKDFEDVMKVHNGCNNLDIDISNYSDERNVNGSLSQESSLKFFESIGAPEPILRTLREGHFSHFHSEVPVYEKRNNRSFYDNEEFAVQAVNSLIEKGKVEVLSHKPHIVNPLSVAVQRTKLRLILDCSFLNGYIEVPRFKYEDVIEGLNYFRKGCSMFKWDLKDGYHQLLIHPEFKKYLGFKIRLKGKETFCQYTVGPFGLRDLPYLYTKIFRVLVRHWRSLGLSAIKFLDDGICFCENSADAEAASLHIRKDLFAAGAFWSVKKSQWEPSSSCEWLGISWDSSDGSISAASHRVEKIKSTIQELSIKGRVHVKALASLAGQINSLQVVVGNCVRLTTRCMQLAIAMCPSWEEEVIVSPSIILEMKFWQSNLDSLNKRCCSLSKAPTCLNIIATDASDTGCGAIFSNSCIKACRLFSSEESSKHSTYRELVAVLYALRSYLPMISFSRVKVLVDNQSAVRILDVGSMKPELHGLAMDVFFLCLRNGISLETQWIPRELNEEADSASREAALLDTDDWQISARFFQILVKRWGPLTIDCFANCYNSKLPRFYSLFLPPDCEGVDAFCFDWRDEFCLLVPPVGLVGRVLKHLALCKGKGILVVPCWPSAHFWPMLSSTFHHSVVDFMRVKGRNVLQPGFNPNSLLGSKEFQGDVLALLMDCS